MYTDDFFSEHDSICSSSPSYEKINYVSLPHIKFHK